MTVTKDFFNCLMKWSHFFIASHENLNLRVQQKHRYKNSTPDCLSDVIDVHDKQIQRIIKSKRTVDQ